MIIPYTLAYSTTAFRLTNSEPSTHSENSSTLGSEIKNFLYETPVWIVAALVAGIALLIIAPLFSVPFLCLAGGFYLTRILVKVLELYFPDTIKQFRALVYTHLAYYPYVEYLALAVTLAVAPFSPIASGIFSVVLAVYKGIVVEINIFKYRQSIEEKLIGQEIPKYKIQLINC